MKIKFIIIVALFLLCARLSFAQTTDFIYQGRLIDSNPTAAANYDFEFRLFDVETGGAPLAVQQISGVPISNGVFTVRLNFGANFTGASRFLEIAVKSAASGAYTPLAPRQRIASVPHAIRALNSTSADGLSISCVGCVTDANVNSLSGGKIAGEIPVQSVPAGSANYIHNANSSQTGNFNISGTGTASVLNATTQFNIGVDRMLAKGAASVFVGRLAGASNIAGSGNSFFGESAGRFNTGGANNSFFGRDAGLANTASNNSFFGAFSGDSNTTGTRNSYFGVSAGDANDAGNDNAFFGYRAGRINTASENAFFGGNSGDSNTTGFANSYFGFNSGAANSEGSGNSFFGWKAGALTTRGANSFFGSSAGTANTVGVNNSFFGAAAGESSTTSGNNSFFGSHAAYQNSFGESNSVFGSFAAALLETGSENSIFGAFAGREIGIYASKNSFFGYRAGWYSRFNHNSFFGHQAGYNTGNFQGTNPAEHNSFFGTSAGSGNTRGSYNSYFGSNAGSLHNDGDYNVFVGAFTGIIGNAETTTSYTTLLGYHASSGTQTLYGTAIGANSRVTTNDTIVLGKTAGDRGAGWRPADTVLIHGNLVLESLGVAGSTSICRNSADQLASCSSSLRYKTNVKTFTGGLDVVKRLRPISFDWKNGNLPDVGFAAEEVAAIEPLLVTRNRQNEIEGVKYAQISTALVNAVKEQQQQIEAQQIQLKTQAAQIKQQQILIENLRALVCRENREAEICKEEKK